MLSRTGISGHLTRESHRATTISVLISGKRFDEEPRGTWYRHFTADKKQRPAPTMQFTGKIEDPGSWLEPAGGKLTFRTVAQTNSATLTQLSSMVHERYSVYHEVAEVT
jgi:hypothetical protein